MAIGKKVLQSILAGAGAVFPRATGKIAFRLFCTPPGQRTPTAAEAKVAERMLPLMSKAAAGWVETADGRVRTYLWSSRGDLNSGERAAVKAEPSRQKVLLVHGWSGRAMVMGAFVEPLLAAGADVVALDLPAHGESSGAMLNLALGARAVQAVAEEMGPFDAVVAHSFGGPIVLLAAEGGPPLSQPMPVRRLVLISAPNSLAEITRDFARAAGLTKSVLAGMEAEISRIAGRPVEALRCDAFLPRIGAGALVIHDADDAEVAFANGEAIAASSRSAHLMRTSRLGHRRIIFAPAVIAAASAFCLKATVETAAQV